MIGKRGWETVSRFFVGSYTRAGGEGIALCEREGSGLRVLYADRSAADPIFIVPSPDGKTVFASAADHRTGGGLAYAWAVREEGLFPLGGRETGGGEACHAALSPNGRFLYVSNYATGSLAVFPVDAKGVGPRAQLICHEGRGIDPKRQECAHIHQAVFRPGTYELFVCDLGMDAVFVYQASERDGLLTRIDRIDGAAPGFGPRHLAFLNADTFYLVYEMGSAVGLFRRVNGVWRCEQTLSTLPSAYRGENTAAAIRLRGDRLYVSNRGHDSIAEVRLSADGAMRLSEVFAASGACPRDFFIDTDGAFVTANQNGGGVTLSIREQALCRLDLRGAVCVCPAIGDR